MACAEAKSETGQKAGTSALDVLANIDAMQLAVDAAIKAGVRNVDEITAIHVIAHADRGCPLVDLRSADGVPGDVLHPDHCIASQPFGAACRRADF